MTLELSVVRDDVLAIEADVLLLKYAQGHYGAEETVAMQLVQHGLCSEADVSPSEGQHRMVSTRSEIPARNVLFLGVQRLRHFRYREMRQFARRAIEVIATAQRPVQTLATTVHGAGYGLDFEEAFRWLMIGFQQGLTTHPVPGLQRLVFVERNARRYEILKSMAADTELVMPAVTSSPSIETPTAPPLEPQRKKSVFVAMPFTDEFEDVYQFGIYSAVKECGYICEKVNESVFTGPIMEQITDGIRNCSFVVADLTLERPNVYLEVGFAWGQKKPVILVAREGQRLHFDVSGYKCIFYKNIGGLAKSLTAAIRDMYGTGSPAGD